QFQSHPHTGAEPAHLPRNPCRPGTADRTPERLGAKPFGRLLRELSRVTKLSDPLAGLPLKKLELPSSSPSPRSTSAGCCASAKTPVPLSRRANFSQPVWEPLGLAILRPIIGPQMRISFSLGGNLEPNGSQQLIQIIHDSLV